LVLSARQADTLNKLIQQVHLALRDHDLDLHDVCGTLSCGRRHQPCRVAVIAKSRKECVEKLQSLSLEATNGRDAVFINLDPKKRPQTAFLFSGQNNGVLREFYEKEPVFAECVHMCQRKLDSGLAGKLFDDRTDREESDVLQGLRVFIEEYALANLLIAYGFIPDALGGSAIGEYTAAVVAGGVSCEDILDSLVKGERISYPLTNQKPVLQVRNSVFSLDTRQDICLASQTFSLVSATEFLKQQGYDFVIPLEQIGSFSALNHLVARGYTEGLPIDWSCYHRGNGFQKVSLALYPFKKTRYWIE
jgi:acyl transferase domain-containing protein